MSKCASWAPSLAEARCKTTVGEVDHPFRVNTVARLKAFVVIVG